MNLLVFSQHYILHWDSDICEELIKLFRICVCSVTQSCPALCSPLDCSSPAPLYMKFSDALFSFCPQSFPASRTFPMSHLFPGVHIIIQCLYSLQNGHHHESISTTCHHAIDPFYCFCPLQPSSLITTNLFSVSVSFVLFHLFNF